MEGEVFPGFPLRAMSHADVISGALTEICTGTSYDGLKSNNWDVR